MGGTGCHVGHAPGISHTGLLIIGSRGSGFEQKFMTKACAVEIKLNGQRIRTEAGIGLVNIVFRVQAFYTAWKRDKTRQD